LRIIGIKYKELNDEKVMQLVINGDSKAFEEIYKRYAYKLLNYFHRMLWKDREKAEDFMHDLFHKIVEKPYLYDPSRSFKTWVYSVANNMCKNEYKKQEIRKTSAKYEIKEEILKGESDVDYDRKIDFKIFNQVLHRELDQFNEEQKETFLLRYMEELSIKEISEAMSCSEGTVKSRLFYTLKKLTPKLKSFAPEKSVNVA